MITNTYATGRVIKAINVGGLIGVNLGGIATNSYWDTESSGTTRGIVGIGRTTMQLRTPTQPGTTSTETYYQWSDDDWDFGTDKLYPAVKYGAKDRGACGVSQQPKCGTLLPGQGPTIETVKNPPRRILVGTTTSVEVILGGIHSAYEHETYATTATSSNTDIVTIESFTPSGTTTRTLVIKGGNKEGHSDITVMAPDGRVTTTLVFRVFVEKSVAPTVNVRQDPAIVQLDGSKNIVINVSDDNSDIDAGDKIRSVDVNVKSSDSDIVSIPDSSKNRSGLNTAMASISFTLSGDKAGTATIIVTATDNYDGITTKEFVVLVNRGPTPRACELSPTKPPVVWTQGQAIAQPIDVSDCFTDPDGDTLRYTATNLPDGVMISSATGVVSGTPTTDTTASRDTTGKLVNVVAADDKGGPITASVFRYLINAETTGTLVIKPIDGGIVPESLTVDVSGVRDQNNGDDTPATPSGGYQWRLNGNPIPSATQAMYRLPETNAGRAAGLEYSVDVGFTDNIDEITKKITTLTASYTIANAPPTITEIIVPESSLIEGTTATLVATVRDPNFDDLIYQWHVEGGDNALLSEAIHTTGTATFRSPNDSTTATLIFVPPAAFVARDDATATAVLRLVVMDQMAATTEHTRVIVVKQNNGALTLGIDRQPSHATTLTSQILAADPDGESITTPTYTWQICVAPCDTDSAWTTPTNVNNDASYTMTTTENKINNRFRVTQRYTDGQGHRNTAMSAPYIVTTPTPVVSIGVDDADGDSVPNTLTAGVSGIIEISRYQWKLNGVPIGGATSPTYSLPLNNEARAAGAVYSLEVTFKDGSKITTTQTPVVNQPPVIDSIEPESVEVGEGDAATITAILRDENFDDLTYSWVTTANSAPLSEADKTTGTASFTLPNDTTTATLTVARPLDFVAEDDNEAMVTLTLTVFDGIASTSTDTTVTVIRRDAGIRLRAKVFLEGPLQ